MRPSGAPASRYSSTIRSAHWGNRRRVLEQHRVPGEEVGGRTPDDLPEREVPGHDGEDRPDGIEPHVRGAAVGFVVARAERLLRGLGVVLRDPRALFCLGDSLGERLSHLESHEPRQVIRLRLQKIREALVHGASFGKGNPAPGAERGIGAGKGGIDLAVGSRREFGHHFFGGGIQGSVEHAARPHRPPPGGWRRLYLRPTSRRSSIEIASRVLPFRPVTVVALSIEL